MSDHSQCIRCKKRDAVTRGVCMPCYVTLSRYVKGGKNTWEDFEKEGKCLPARAKKQVEPTQDSDPVKDAQKAMLKQMEAK